MNFSEQTILGRTGIKVGRLGISSSYGAPVEAFEEAFERAFELTKSYAGSANAQASAIPSVFEKLFELFVTGKNKS